MFKKSDDYYAARAAENVKEELSRLLGAPIIDVSPHIPFQKVYNWARIISEVARLTNKK